MSDSPNKDKMKIIWKSILKYSEEEGLFQIPVFRIWEDLQKEFADWEEFISMVRALDSENRIMYNEAEELVTLTV